MFLYMYIFPSVLAVKISLLFFFLVVHLFFTDPGLLKMRLSSLICCCGSASTLKPRLTKTRLIRTPHYYGQFALSLGKALTFLRFLSIRTLVGGRAVECS